MKITLLTVGKMKKGPEYDMFQEYLKRFKSPLNLIEIKTSTKSQENQDLIKKLPQDAYIILLDERGNQKRSENFASYLGKIEHHKKSHIYFVIGGAEGFESEIKDMANDLLSLSKMTLPHKMVRVLLIEQLYRAQQILSGHPYHKD